MNWTTKAYKNGDIRVRNTFAWLPIGQTTDGVTKWFWLQKVAITEEFESGYGGEEWVFVSVEVR